jgi:Pyruvate/2-oxoacid:ferredoxin oxidoreductase delta subunit
MRRMGHLGSLKAEYQALADRLDAGQIGLPEPEDESARIARKEILEILFSPEEAEIASRVPVMPARLEEIARRTRIGPDELRPKLDAMAERGLVLDLVHPVSGEVRWLLAPPVVGFFEFSMMRINEALPQKRLAQAFEAYFHGSDAFAKEVFGHDTVIGRALVHETALGDELPEVLPYERATALVEETDDLSVSLCFCRHKAEHLGRSCDTPQEICLSLGGGARFVARRGLGRTIERSEALEILAHARENDLVHIADNVRNKPTWICSCCACCCEQLGAINQYDLRAVNPSGFQPQVDPQACKGCSRCARHCPISAITMHAVRVDARRRNDLRPEIDIERCIGCGICADECRNRGMRMVRREKQAHVPQNVIERSVRMALERGRLAHLLVDQGASRGSHFLGSVLKVLTSLPAAERALASEQVRSRFVRAALSRVRDPMG